MARRFIRTALVGTALSLLPAAGRAQNVRTGDPAFEASPAFATVSVRPSPAGEADDWGSQVSGRRLIATYFTMFDLLGYAYGLNLHQIENAPAWFATERFDVEGVPDTDTQPTGDQYRVMVQKALSERFGLRSHLAQKLLPVYTLSVAAGGLKIPDAAEAARPGWGVQKGTLTIRKMSFSSVAKVLQRTIFDRPVLDQTGLTDSYTFVLRWRPDETQFGQLQGVDAGQESGVEEREDIFTSARKQLGLRIEAKRALAPAMVIDAVSLPTAN